MPYEFETLSADTLRSLPAHQTVFFFPVGPMEDHGPHLPLGLDLMEARKLSALTAEKLETEMPGWVGVIMPSAPLGIDTATTRVSLTVRGHVLRDWLVDACRSLKRLGFCHFVCFSGNLGPKQLTAIEDAAKMISRRGLLTGLLLKNFRRKATVTLVSASSALTTLQDVKNSPVWPDPLEHGGERDTSVALAIALKPMPSLYASLQKVDRPSSKWVRWVNRISSRTQGYWGNPAQADSEKGSRILNGSIQDIFPKLRAVWEGADPNHLFRSWYSILPPNKSFLKGYVLAFVFLMLIWLYLNFFEIITS